MKTQIEQVLTYFGDYEKNFYQCLPAYDRQAYGSYIGVHKLLQTKKPLMPPTEWIEARYMPTDLETIGQVLGISRGAVSAYMATGFKKIRRIIAQDPVKYKDLIDYIGG